MAKSSNVSPLRAISSRFNQMAKDELTTIRKTHTDERKAMRQKHRDEVNAIKSSAKTKSESFIRKLMDELLEQEKLQTPAQQAAVVKEVKVKKPAKK